MKSKPRKTSSRKPFKLDQIHRSQKRILAAFAKQTAEIGILRRYVLEMRNSYLMREFKEKCEQIGPLGGTVRWPSFAMTDSIDSVQPKL